MSFYPARLVDNAISCLDVLRSLEVLYVYVG